MAAAREAREGDLLKRLECKCGAVLVLSSRAAEYTCSWCRRRPRPTHAVILGKGGAVPAPEEWKEV